MNKKIYTGFCVLALMAAASCQKHLDDIVPNGEDLSLDQVKSGALVSDARAQAGLPGLYAQLTADEGVYAIQGDFGYPSFVARLEHAGDNVVSTVHGYNWFQGELRHAGFQHKTSIVSNWAWIATYKNIKLANDILAPYAGQAIDASVASVVGQARAMRAWDYFLLAQLFAKTYKGNEASLCVPIITETTPASQLSNNPRRTVQEVYDFIIKDLDEAVKLLAGFKPQTKSGISEAVAYGIRARVHLVMNEWAKAAQDAQKAIDLFKAQGGRPYTRDEAGVPGFHDVEANPNAMWGIIIGAEDNVTKSGIANWTSMFTSLCVGNTAYTTTVGTYKRINTRLFDLIPTTDIRRDWWAHEKKLIGKTKEGNDVYGYTSPILTRAYGTEVAAKLERGQGFPGLSARFLPHTVFKFAPNDNNLSSLINAVDFILMRVEEMYYILAEAQAMGGNTTAGLKTLVDFVKEYRDTGYAFSNTDAKAIQDEIYKQRRIEFWGEGISWFDVIRLKKGLDRVDVTARNTGGYPKTTLFNIEAESATFTFQIPENEEQNNKAIMGNNNPLAPTPSDMI